MGRAVNHSLHPTFVIGRLRLEAQERCVTRDEQPVPLTPKEFDTLLALVEAGGRLVEKEDLMARVWPDSYVGEGSLTRNISVFRRSLGKDLIQTVPRRGYRIGLPVVSTDAGSGATTRPQLETPTIADRAITVQPAPWWKPSAIFGSALAAVVVIVFAVAHFLDYRTAKADTSSMNPIRSILIEKSGGLDPLTEGFTLHRPDGDYPHVIYNREANGWDRWRLVTDDQNYYTRPLSTAEKDFALQKDWKLTCVCALESGAGEADIDFAGKGPRFDIQLLQEGKRYFVGLTKQISPTIEVDDKIEFPGVADVAHPHTYELRYDHLSKTASLWIDGKEMASGYRGHYQFQEDRGLLFGVALYGNVQKSSAVFQQVRFEAK
jgi:DNA-binding winged helix-turn-helix (wHTH) protein